MSTWEFLTGRGISNGTGPILLTSSARWRLMPREARNAPGGLIYHVLNRAAGKGDLFRHDSVSGRPKPATSERFKTSHPE
jgi:hypothetical protein